MRKNKKLIVVLSGLTVSTIIVFVVIPLLINFWTKIKCRGSFSKDAASEEISNSFNLNDQAPLCFWLGNGITDSKNIKF
ncbi:MAG: hypothetical protein ACOYBL_13795 [Lachnospiraceae bacterium]|jgi:hypothetical protein